MVSEDFSNPNDCIWGANEHRAGSQPGEPRLHSPVVAPHHPVRVQHGDELEDEHPAQHLGTGILLPQDEVQEAVEDEAGGGFSRVDSAAEEKHLGTNGWGEGGVLPAPGYCAREVSQTRSSPWGHDTLLLTDTGVAVRCQHTGQHRGCWPPAHCGLSPSSR